MGGQRRHVAAAEGDAPAVGRQVPRDAVEERGLARAVWSDQADQLALADVEVDALEGGDAEEPLGQSANLNHGFDARSAAASGVQ